MNIKSTNFLLSHWRCLTLALCGLLLLSVPDAIAQDRTIKGKVISADSNEPLPGVNVIVKGTSQGTVTDIAGNYTLSVGADSDTLSFSFIGFVPQDIAIGNQSTIDARLGTDTQQLSEVVVTALGIEREKRSLGYALQEVTGESLSQAQAGETNLINTLNGKIAGVQVSGNTGAAGGSSRILIRGANSIAGNNQPLFVIDGVPVDNSNYLESAGVARGTGGYDYGNAMQDINPADIASMSVLKGASAAALYGTRASNGVILITTKKGQNNKKIGVDVNLGVTVQTPLVLPKFQNEYGGGSGPFTLNNAGENIPAYNFDQSWGPRLDGRPARQWYSYYPEIPEYFGQSTPWEAHPDNYNDFLRTQVTWNNNISFSGGGEKSDFRLSYNNLSTSGLFPNQEFDRNNVSFNGGLNLTEKFRATAAINYVNTRAYNRPQQGYGDIIVQYYHFGQRQLDDRKLRDYYITPTGEQRSWNRISAENGAPQYSDNPYWIRNKNFQNDGRDRFFGNFTLSYDFTDWLKLTGRVLNDFYTDRREERIAVGSVAQSEYYKSLRQNSEINSDLILTANLNLTEDISFNGLVGGNLRYNRSYENITTTVGGLSVADFYNLTNSIDRPTITDRTFTRRINSLFGSVTFGYRDFVYLDATLRNDWSSTLPADNNSFLYPSVSGSVIFSEFIDDNSILNFGKIRASVAQVGADTDPYRLVTYFEANTPFNGIPSFSTIGQLNNAVLRPERTNSWEVGAQLGFLEDRLGLDVTYFSTRAFDQIFPVAVTAASGFTSQIINAGEMTNRGVEVLLTATPVATENFTWNLDVNYSWLDNEVVALTPGIDNYQLSIDVFGNLSVNAREGEPYGAIVGTNFVYADGRKVINPNNGNYARSAQQEVLGSVIPDWRGGIRSTFNYKGINLMAQVDGSFGNELHSTTNMFGKSSGMMEETTNGNIRQVGLIADGVILNADGESYRENDIVVDPQNFFDHFGLGAAHVYDASYIKLREISLGYTLPSSWLGRLPISSVNVSLVGRNLALLYSKIPHLDPESVTNAGNVQGFEGGALPSLRSYGVNIKLSL